MRPTLLPIPLALLVALLGCPTHEDDMPGPPELDDDDAGDDDDGDDDLGDDDELPSDDDTAEDLLQLELAYAWSDAGTCMQIHAGNMVDVDGDGAVEPDEPRQLWLVSDPGDNDTWGTALVGHDGSLYASVLHGLWGAGVTVGELDGGHDGLEMIAVTNDGDQDLAAAFAADGTTLWTTTLPEYSAYRPWLTDLEGDGALEVLVGPFVLDAHTGTQLATLEGAAPVAWSVAADLDLDGTREIVTMTTDGTQEVRLHDAGGALEATCWHGLWNWAVPAFAVGDLDGDPEGEVVMATTNHVVICDHDGTLLGETEILAGQPAMTALVQLDGDDLPEIVVGDALGIVALDTDLSELWTYEGQAQGNNLPHHPLTAADLDGDGRHEILTRMMDRLVVLGPDGQERASITGSAVCSGWDSAPAVLDIDADGLAEIVVPAWEGFAIVDNPYGGWLVDGADEPWPAVDKHPGDRTAGGGIPAPLDVHWADPRTNVWQGLPAWK